MQRLSKIAGILILLLAVAPASSAEFATSFTLKVVGSQNAGTGRAVAAGWQAFALNGSVEYRDYPEGPDVARIYGGFAFAELGVGNGGPSARLSFPIPVLTTQEFLGRNNLYVIIGYEKFFNNDDLSGPQIGLVLQIPD